MAREILTVVETVSNEKGVPREAIFEALEQALVAATKKKFYEGTNSEEAQLRVEIDRKTGEYSTFRQWEVVADEDHEMPACQDAISDVDPAQWSIGDIRELEVPSIDFGRIAAQIAKQVIVQKIREAERALIADAYESKAMSISGLARDNCSCAPRPSRFTLNKIAFTRCFGRKISFAIISSRARYASALSPRSMIKPSLVCFFTSP
jgi:hypothetical protein